MKAAQAASETFNVVRVFVSYSHKDSYFFDMLHPVLKFISGVEVRPWTDKEIQPGVRWDDEIKTALREMDVFVPLVSVHFVTSEYIRSVEWPIAEERHQRKEIEVVPVIVHDPGEDECDWLMKLQRLPPGDKTWAEGLKEFERHDMALCQIRKGIKEVAKRVGKRKDGERVTCDGTAIGDAKRNSKTPRLRR